MVPIPLAPGGNHILNTGLNDATAITSEISEAHPDFLTTWLLFE